MKYVLLVLLASCAEPLISDPTKPTPTAVTCFGKPCPWTLDPPVDSPEGQR